MYYAPINSKFNIHLFPSPSPHGAALGYLKVVRARGEENMTRGLPRGVEFEPFPGGVVILSGSVKSFSS